jgi:hypothetical protein
LKVNQGSLVGPAISTTKSGGATGDGLTFTPEGASKVSNIFRRVNIGSGWSATLHEARITDEGYIQFPQYHHRSDFDEYLSGGSTALTSTVIAKAYWAGSGTGTQVLYTGLNEDKNTYIKLATNGDNGSTSAITFGRYIALEQACVEFRTSSSEHTNGDNTTNTYTQIGLYGPDNGYYAWFNFDTSVDSTNIYAECYNGTLTRTDTGRDIDLNWWHSFRIHLYVNYAYFYIDDVLCATIEANVPSSDYLKPYACVGAREAATKELYIDFANVWKGRTDLTYPS